MKNAYEIKELLDNGGSICIYDTETTGLKKPESRILSFSAIIVRKVDGHLQEEKRMDILMDPECDIPDLMRMQKTRPLLFLFPQRYGRKEVSADCT